MLTEACWHAQVASSYAQSQRLTGEAVKAAAHDAIAEALPRELAGPALKVILPSLPSTDSV